MAKFRNKYRIESNRMPYWDYAGKGMYFITFVTQNRVCNLGEIQKIDGKAVVVLSDFGKIVKSEWLKSFEIRDELFCDEYIIMPNHLHAIVILKKMKNNKNKTGGMDGYPDYHGYHGYHVETHGRASLLFRKPQSISSFIAGFKSVVNSKIDDYIDEKNLNIPKYNRNNHFFQPNYYDHIIRNKKEYYRIKNYIINNPDNWNIDKFNNKNNRDI